MEIIFYFVIYEIDISKIFKSHVDESVKLYKVLWVGF